MRGNSGKCTGVTLPERALDQLQRAVFESRQRTGRCDEYAPSAEVLRFHRSGLWRGRSEHDSFLRLDIENATIHRVGYPMGIGFRTRSYFVLDT